MGTFRTTFERSVFDLTYLVRRRGTVLDIYHLGRVFATMNEQREPDAEKLLDRYTTRVLSIIQSFLYGTKIMDREWEKFRGGPTVASRDRLHITVGKNGLLYMNSNAHRMLGRPGAVYLHFNRSKDLIALEPSNPRLPESFPVRQKREGVAIYATPFFRHFGIRVDRTEMFVRPDLSSDGKMLVLDLSTMVAVTRPPRKRKK